MLIIIIIIIIIIMLGYHKLRPSVGPIPQRQVCSEQSFVQFILVYHPHCISRTLSLNVKLLGMYQTLGQHTQRKPRICHQSAVAEVPAAVTPVKTST